MNTEKPKPVWHDATHDQIFRALIPEYKPVSIPGQQSAADPGAHEHRAVTREGTAATVKISQT